MKSHKLNLTSDSEIVEKYEFEPIQGYPMLNWKGKRPFRSTQYYPAQLKEVHGPDVNGWRNKLYWGDNLQIMSYLLKEYRSKIKLVYIDAPYDSKADYKKTIQLRGQKISNDLNVFEEKQYTDIWSNDEYLQFMYERLILIRELLSANGVIYLHCDWHKGHYLRCVLDEVFGPRSFVNEIVWYYYNKMQGNINKFASNHDVIYVYSKSQKFTFNKIRESREKPIQQIKRIWDKESQSLVNAKDENGNIIYITSTHKTVDDVWRLPMLQPADRTELVGYPTQKPESLIERVIRASTKPGDLIFDCFMGAGTVQAVALKLGRRFIGADINLGAIQTTLKRLLEITGEINLSSPYVPSIKNGLNDYMDNSLFEDEEEGYKKEIIKDFYCGFEYYTVNKYDVFRNPVEAKHILVEALEIQPLASSPTSIYDGEKDSRMVKIMPINRIATQADLNELINGFDYKTFERRRAENPTKPVEKILLVCMGHEQDLAAALKAEMGKLKFSIDVEVRDILRDDSRLEFKRDSEAKIAVKKGNLVIERFYPMNLLQKLSLMKENVDDWRQLVESVMIDWNYDGAVLTPAVVDLRDGNPLVKGSYPVPKSAGTIRVKITDLLSESWEGGIQYA
jgi:DNA modification methylase